jgi:hypothetical protein
MTDLLVSAAFTKNTAQPATALVLAEIDMYLTRVHRSTGVDAVVWDGTQNPTEEIDNMGAYHRILTTADLDTYFYFAIANYTGATVLDQDWVAGAVGLLTTPIGTAEERTYTVTDSVTTNPIQGVKVDVARDLAGTDIIWVGWSDTFGVARDINGNLPRLDPGTYYFFKNRVGYVPDAYPDTEVFT